MMTVHSFLQCIVSQKWLLFIDNKWLACDHHIETDVYEQLGGGGGEVLVRYGSE